MEQIIQFTGAWVAVITAMLVVRHRYEPASVTAPLRWIAWLAAVGATVPVLAITASVLWPGLHPLELTWLRSLAAGTTPFGDLQGLAFAATIVLVSAIGAWAVRRRSYGWLVVIVALCLTAVGATPGPTTAARIVCMAAGLTGMFWAAGAMFHDGDEQPTMGRTVAMYLVTLLVPWALVLGYWENDRLHAAALADGLANANRAPQLGGIPRASLEVVARQIADGAPHSPRAAQARLILDAGDAGTYTLPDGSLLEPAAVVTRFADLVGTRYVSTILDRYGEACLASRDSADCAARQSIIVTTNTQRARALAAAAPWPEQAALLDALAPLDELDAYPEVDRFVDDVAGMAARRIKAMSTPIPVEARAKLAECNGLYKSRRYPDAAACYRGLATLAPRSEDVRNNLGLAEWRAGHFTAARVHFTIITKTAPRYPGAELNLAVVEYMAGNASAAIARLDRLVAAYPAYVSAIYNRAWILDEQGDANGARRAATAVVKAKQDHLGARLLLALGQARAGQLASAMKAVDAAREYADDDGKKMLTAFFEPLRQAIAATSKAP